MKTSRLLLLGALMAVLPGTFAAYGQAYEPYTFTTFAGNPPGSANGTGTAARFDTPSGVAVDSAGNSYVADTNNHTIRKITPAGEVTTFAGLVRSAGNTDGLGSAARFNSPYGVAVDSADNIFVTDTNNGAIRKITPAGEVSTVISGLSGPKGMAVDNGGNLYVTVTASSFSSPAGVRKIAPGNIVTTVGSGLFLVTGVTVDSGGNVYVADGFNHRIAKIAPDGTMTTLAGGGFGSADGTGTAAKFNSPGGVTVDGSGNVYVADTNNQTIRKVTPAGEVTTLAGLAGSRDSTDGVGNAARFAGPRSVAVDSGGNVYVADTGNNSVRKIASAGAATTLAGLSCSGSEDGPAAAARFTSTQQNGVAVSANGNVYVADITAVRKITPAGMVSTLAGLSGSPGSVDGTGSAARFGSASAIAIDSAENVYVGDLGNNTIRKITPGGVVTTLAGMSGSPGSADGAGTVAQFNQPIGIAADSGGTVYVADLNNGTIRKITPDGTVSTLAGLAGSGGFGPSVDGTGSDARFSGPAAIAINPNGDLYVAERFSGKVRRVTPAGVVTTVNLSPTPFLQAAGLAVDSTAMYAADFFSRTIRKVSGAGVITIVGGFAAGTGYADGTGAAARFVGPSSIAVDNAGRLYVMDNNCIRIGELLPAATTPVGSSVPVIAGSAGATSIDLNFGQVTQAGTTTVSVINPDYAGALPSGYQLAGSNLAFEISTTAAYVAPIVIGFRVAVDPATFSQLRVLHNENGTLVDRTSSKDAANQIIYASVSSLSPFILVKPTQTLSAAVQSPINADGSSVFNVKRGVVPVKFILSDGGVPTCSLPAATIVVTRTAGGTVGAVNESLYSAPADTGSNFRIDSCQYIYNLNSSGLGLGTYRVDIKINGQVAGSGTFQLK